MLVSTAKLLEVELDAFADLALQAQPGSGGLVLVPYFEGERTPNLPHAKASLHGMTIASTTRENLARAAHEGMLSGLGAGLDAVRAVGVRDRRLLLIGGAAHSTAVQTVAAQVFDSPVVVPAPGEYVAEGAAVQAAWVLRVSARTGRSTPSPSPTPIITLKSGSSTGATRPRWPRPPGTDRCQGEAFSVLGTENASPTPPRHSHLSYLVTTWV